MRKLGLMCILFSVGLCASLTLAEDSYDIKWIQQLGTSDWDECYGTDVDGSGNVFVAGRTRGDLAGANAGDYDGFIAKYGKNGNLLWIRQLGGSGYDMCYDVAVDALGNSFVAGIFTSGGDRYALLAKYDNNGNSLWTRLLGDGIWGASGYCVGVDNSGNAFLAGYTRYDMLNPFGGRRDDGFIAKYGNNGNLLWIQQLYNSRECRGIAADNSGNIFVTGRTYDDLGGTNAGYSDAFIVKYDNNGNSLWARQLGSSSTDLGQDIAVDNSGNAFVAGYTYGDIGGDNMGEKDAFLAKYDNNGNSLWVRQIGSSRNDECRATAIDGSGNVFIAGSTYGDLIDPTGRWDGSPWDGFLIKYDNNGNLFWIQQLGTTSSDGFFDVAVDSSGNAFVAGYTSGSLGGINAGIRDTLLIKHDAWNYLSFSSISEQQLDTDFNVTIAARKSNGQIDTSVNGNVRLYISGGPYLDKTSVYMRDGVWTGTLQLLNSPGDPVYIRASLSNITGISNTFNVTSQANAYGKIEGYCTNSVGVPIVGVPITVELKKDTTVIATTTTNESTGKYIFTNVNPGIYAIEARGSIDGNITRSTIYPNHIATKGTTTRNLKIYQGGVPVLLVPGIMGSCTGGTTINGPLDEKLNDLKIYMPFNADYVGWVKLSDDLKEKGFEVFEVPWDWRREIDDTTVNWYLKNKIDEAKAATARGKVHIISHSAGGLLTRYYIQSDDYENDVDKFAMAGTPNGGAAGDPYYLWEGGDLERIVDTLSIKKDFIENIYDDQIGGQLWSWSNDNPRNVEIKYHISRIEVKEFIREAFPGLKHFMSVGDPLLAYKDSEGIYNYINYPGEEFLTTYELAHDPDKTRLVPGNAESVNDDQVRTRIFITESQKTAQSIIFNEYNESPNLYPLGVPIGVIDGYGDGTILNSSAKYGLTLGTHYDLVKNKSGKHAKLPNIYADDIVAFLQENINVPAGLPEMLIEKSSLLETAPQEILNWLSVEIDGRVQPQITSPTGQRSGITNAGNMTDELAGDISIKPEFSMISVADPNNGSYTLDFTGETDKKITITVHYAAGDDYFSVKRMVIAKSENISLPITLDSSNEEPLHIVEPISSVANITASPVTSMAFLQWDDISDPALTTYRVYGKRNGYRLYTLLAETTQSQFQTIHPWYEDNTMELWQYIVVAVNTDGDESFLDSSVSNQTKLISRFTTEVSIGKVPFIVSFTDQSAGNPTSWEWDFNADGVIDSTEQNPTWTYTEPGVNTVILKVISDKGSDVSIRTEYINVFQWSIADLSGDSIVNLSDFAILACQWQLEKLRWDAAPAGGDGIVNLLDFAAFAIEWEGTAENIMDLFGFSEQWLQSGVHSADIAPVSYGDGVVDMLDLQLLAENWLEGVGP